MGNLNLPQIAINQDQKEQVSNDADAKLETALTNPLTLDFTSGNVTLTSTQFQSNMAFLATNNSVSRSLTVPALTRALFYVLNSGTAALSIIRGSTTLSLAAGKSSFFSTDGTTNGLSYVQAQANGSGTLAWQGAWSSVTAYQVNDVVQSGGSSYICILANTNNVPPNATYWQLVASKGDTGPTGGTGSTGPMGGSAISIRYLFSTTTTDSDPGNGNLRLDNATQLSATTIRADLLDTFSTDWTTALDALDDSTSSIKGFIRLVKESDNSKWILFSVGSVAAPSGYRNITVTEVDGSGVNPFSNGDAITLVFMRNGDKGDTGATGATGSSGGLGSTGLPGGPITIEYNFSTTTTDADPGNGNMRLNNATQLSATSMFVDLLDDGGTDWTAVLDTLADSTSTIKGQIRMVKKADFTKWIEFNITAVVSATGYRKLTVAEVAASGANPFANADVVYITFTRTGDQGNAGPTGPTGPTGNGTMMMFFGGLPAASEKLFIGIVATGFTLAASLTGSEFAIGTNPTSTLTITLKKNGSSIGTVAFSTGGVPTVTFASPVSFVAGDLFEVDAPGSQDATGADISLSFLTS